MNAALKMPAEPAAPSQSLPFTNLGVIGRELGSSTETMRGLSPSAKHLLDKLLAFLGEHHEAWPTQKTLARESGLSGSTIRRATHELEQTEVIIVARLRRPDLTTELRYTRGPALLEALEVLRERYADRPRAKYLAPPLPPIAPIGGGFQPDRGDPSSVNAPHPSIVSAKLSEEIKINSSLPEPEPERAGEPPPEAEAIARDALAYRFTKWSPGLKPPRLLDAGTLAMVVDRAEQVPGTLAERLHAMRLAIDAADVASLARTSKPATPRFIWGTADHFAAHLAAGRAGEPKPKTARTKTIVPAAAPGMTPDEAFEHELATAESYRHGDYQREVRLMGAKWLLPNVTDPNLIARYKTLTEKHAT